MGKRDYKGAQEILGRLTCVILTGDGFMSVYTCQKLIDALRSAACPVEYYSSI